MSGYFDWKKPRLYKPESLLCDWLIITLLTAACMMATIDLLGSVIVQSQIQGYLAVDDTRTVWIGKSFFFMAAIAPLYAIHLACLYGYKRLFFIGMAIFMVGSTSSGLASSYWMMILTRALAGIGTGIIFSITLNYISSIIPNKLRESATIFYSNVFFGLGIAFGCLIGGRLGQIYAWKMIFLLNIPIAIPTLLLMLLLLPETERRVRPPFDALSFFSLVSALFLALVVVTQAKAPWNTLGWHSPFIHICMGAAFALFLLFIYGCTRVAHPLVRLQLFRHPRYIIGCLGMFVVGLMIFGVTIAQMGILEEIYLYERATIGMFISLVGVIYFIGGVIPSLLFRFIHPRYFILAGFLCIVPSCLMNQMITIQSDMWQIGALMALRSLGISLVLGPLVLLALSNISHDGLPKATAFLSFVRLIAATFGSAVISLIIDMRRPFHSLRFGEQVNIQSARYRQYSEQLNEQLFEGGGSTAFLSDKQSRQLMIDYIERQAEVAALNDALTILGWLSGAILAVIATLMIYRVWSLRHTRIGSPEPELGI